MDIYRIIAIIKGGNFMTIRKEDIIDVIELLLMIALSACILYTLYVFVTKFGYRSDLGVYDTRAYSFKLGDYLKYGKDALHYTYTNLNFIEVMDRIW